jgi:hypothetical protein
VTRRNGDNLSKHRYLLSAQTCKGLRSHDLRWIPFSNEHVRLRGVDTHGQVEQAFWGWEPVVLLVFAWAFALEIQV